MPAPAPAPASKEQGTDFGSFFKGALDSPAKPSKVWEARSCAALAVVSHTGITRRLAGSLGLLDTDEQGMAL